MMHYIITHMDPCSHCVEVQFTFAPLAARSVIGLPNWIPGSYKIRDFSKHVITVTAKADKKEIRCVAIDKCRWEIQAQAKKIEVTYKIYAKDMSVRTAYLDDQLCFMNPSSVCMYLEGAMDVPCVLTLTKPSHRACKTWHVDTAMDLAKKGAQGFGTYKAENYDALIDHPFLIGDLTTVSFKAGGLAHRMTLVGARDVDTARLEHDLKKMCETQIKFFGKIPVKKAYVFLTWAVSHGYGGLEHRSSSALMCPPDMLPYEGMPKDDASYADFLSLCSHEYFHTWHVKQSKPCAFMPYDLSKENYTRQLWIFEGFTAYYEDVLLLRAGVITENRYLAMLSQKITQLVRNPGYNVQSVSDASFCAWIKFYDPNENSPNATVSYYVKGAMIAWGLDVMLRRGGQSTLDDLIRHLWSVYGAAHTGVPEGTVEAWVRDHGGKKLANALDTWVNGVEPLPLIAWAKAAGWTLSFAAENPESSVDLGVRLMNDAKNTISVCLEGGAAQRAGISAGDELVALDGIALRSGQLYTHLSRYQVNEKMRVHVFRHDTLREYSVTLLAAPLVKATLTKDRVQ